MRILGLVGATHDSGLAILDDGRIEIVLEEERFDRIKRTKAFPRRSMIAALGERAEGLAGIDVITTPWDVARLRRSFLGAVVRRFPASLAFLLESSHTPQRNEIVLLNGYLDRKLRRLVGDRPLPPVVNVGHHDSHAAAFFVSPFDEATVLVMDGFGDDAATSVYTGAGNRLTRHWHTHIFNSVGMVYTLVTEFLGFGGFADEGKVMALAAYGDDSLLQRFRDVIRLRPEGRYEVNMSYFSYDSFGELRPFKRKFIQAFGPSRAPGEEITERHRALAAALQRVTEDTILHVLRGLERRHPSRNLVLAGGVALNCVANARILAETGYQRVWVPPCASDTGAPLGSALWHYHQTLGHARTGELEHAFYGLAYPEAEILAALQEAGLAGERLALPELVERVARDLADGRVVGWFQGRFEMGPRALGNRSILADPRRAIMKDVINARIKQREPFRPFAPAVLEERASELFEISQPDPFMTLAPRVRPEKRHLIPAAVHVDGTGRIQTVGREQNPRYHALIEAFAKLTGVPVVLNTSFNRQEPIVASPAEAISCFLRTDMDVLVLGDHYVVDRNAGAVERARAAFSRRGA